MAPGFASRDCLRNNRSCFGFSTDLQLQQRAGELALLRKRLHYCREDGDLHTERGNRSDLHPVSRIDNESAGEIGVEFCDAQCGWLVTKLSKHFVGRTLQRFPADDWTNRRNFFSSRSQQLTDIRNGENRPDAD